MMWVKMNKKKFPLRIHLEELRRRLQICIFTTIIFSLLCYIYWPVILSLISINKINLIYISPQEAFIVRIKVSLICGVLSSVPIILYEIWEFLKPALTSREKKLTIAIGMVSSVLFYAGIFFNIFFVTPFVVNFFIKTSQPVLTPLISISNYTSFLVKMTTAFALVSQIPMLMVLGTVLGIINSGQLIEYRQITILVIFVIAAVLTPPDALSQLALALPMWGLYELGLLLIKYVK